MNEQKLQDNLYWLLIVVNFTAKKGLIKIAEQNDMTVVQLYALCSMEPGHPMPMKDIANLLNCDASNVTGIIDRLFLHNYIVREESLEDRRVKMVLLTTKGEELRKKLEKDIVAYKSDLLEKLNDSEKAEFKNLALKMLS